MKGAQLFSRWSRRTPARGDRHVWGDVNLLIIEFCSLADDGLLDADDQAFDAFIRSLKVVEDIEELRVHADEEFRNLILHLIAFRR